MGEERVRLFFESRGISKGIVRFEETTENSHLAAQTLDVEVGRIAKSILFIADSRPLMIVISGDRKVDEKKVKVLTGCKKVRMARPEQVMEYTGFEVGGVSPVGHKTLFQIYIDISLKRFETVFPAAGEHNNMFQSSYDELLGMTGGMPSDVARSE